jgi:hypothetical protein
LSVDPVTASSANGSNFNRYKYAANNPYRFIDPDGRAEVNGFVNWLAPPGDIVRVAGEAIGAEIVYIQGLIAGDQHMQDVAIQGMEDNVKPADSIAAASMAVGPRGGGGRAGAAGGPRAGKPHTPAANRLGRAENRAANGGELKCPTCSKPMNEPVQSRKGGGVDRDAAVGDHLIPRAKGGDGATVRDMRNHETKCWECNSRKSDK